MWAMEICTDSAALADVSGKFPSAKALRPGVTPMRSALVIAQVAAVTFCGLRVILKPCARVCHFSVAGLLLRQLSWYTEVSAVSGSGSWLAVVHALTNNGRILFTHWLSYEVTKWVKVEVISITESREASVCLRGSPFLTDRKPYMWIGKTPLHWLPINLHYKRLHLQRRLVITVRLVDETSCWAVS